MSDKFKYSALSPEVDHNQPFRADSGNRFAAFNYEDDIMITFSMSIGRFQHFIFIPFDDDIILFSSSLKLPLKFLKTTNPPPTKNFLTH